MGRWALPLQGQKQLRTELLLSFFCLSLRLSFSLLFQTFLLHVLPLLLRLSFENPRNSDDVPSLLYPDNQ